MNKRSHIWVKYPGSQEGENNQNVTFLSNTNKIAGSFFQHQQYVFCFLAMVTSVKSQ